MAGDVARVKNIALPLSGCLTGRFYEDATALRSHRLVQNVLNFEIIPVRAIAGLLIIRQPAVGTLENCISPSVCTRLLASPCHNIVS